MAKNEILPRGAELLDTALGRLKLLSPLLDPCLRVLKKVKIKNSYSSLITKKIMGNTKKSV